MTRIILMVDTQNEGMLILEDTRAPRELVKMINTGSWLPGEDLALDNDFDWSDMEEEESGLSSQSAGLVEEPAGSRGTQGGRRAATHWAVSHGGLEVVTVVPKPPPVALRPRHYDILFGLADGHSANKIAGQLGISRRTVYLYIAELKERLGAKTRAHLLALATAQGLISWVGSLYGKSR